MPAYGRPLQLGRSVAPDAREHDRNPPLRPLALLAKVSSLDVQDVGA